MRDSVSALGVQFVEQTGAARARATPCRRRARQPQGYEDVIVLYGDVPLIRSRDDPEGPRFPSSTAGGDDGVEAMPEDPDGYGRVVRKSPDSDEIREIVEQKALTPEAAKMREINSGFLRLCHQAVVCPHRQPGDEQRTG